MSVLRRLVGRIRARRAATEEPILPPNASLIALQPSATLPERSYDLMLLAAVLALLGLGTIEIYSATAGESLTQFNDSSHYLQRQITIDHFAGEPIELNRRGRYRD